MFLLRDSVDSVKQIKKTVILATFRMRLRLGLYLDADLHCGTVLEDEFGLSLLRNLIMILANKRSGSVRPKKPHSAIRQTQTQSPRNRFTVSVSVYCRPYNGVLDYGKSLLVVVADILRHMKFSTHTLFEKLLRSLLTFSNVMTLSLPAGLVMKSA